MDKKILYVLAGMFAVLSFSVAATAAMVPSIAAYFNVPAIAGGRLVWAYMLAYGVCALAWAPLSRKITARAIIVFSLAMFSLSAALVSVSPFFSIAVLGRIFMGVFGSCFVPLSLIVIGKEVHADRRARYAGVLFSVGYASSLIGVFLSGFVFWRVIYIVPALAAFGVFIFAGGNLKGCDYRGTFKISYADTFRDKEPLALFAFIFIGSLLYHSVQPWIGVFLSFRYSLPQVSISLVFTVAAVTAILAEAGGGFLSSRFGSKRIAYVGLIGMALFLIMLHLLKTPGYIFFIIIIWGLGWSFNHVGLSSLLTALPDRFLRDASSLNSSLRFVSGGAGAFLGGRVVESMGFSTHFIIVAAALIILSVILKNSFPNQKPTS